MEKIKICILLSEQNRWIYQRNTVNRKDMRIDYLSLIQGKVKMSKEQWALRSKDFIMEGIF